MSTKNWLTKTFIAGNVLSSSDLNQFRDNFLILENHNHAGAPGTGSASLNTASDEGYLDCIQVFMRFPKSQTGFTYFQGGFSSNNGISFNQNDEIVFPVGLKAGTWTLTAFFSKDSSYGIGTFYLDLSSIGAIDFYNATAQAGRTGSIASINVAASAWYDLKMKMETKNASSSDYVSVVNLFELVRTA